MLVAVTVVVDAVSVVDECDVDVAVAEVVVVLAVVEVPLIFAAQEQDCCDFCHL